MSSKEAQQRWRSSPKGLAWKVRPENVAKQRARTRSWHARNPEVSRVLRDKNHRKRKEGHGRVCGSCGRRDQDTYWSSNNGYCAACYGRGQSNGWCQCGAAKWFDRRRRDGKSYCKECREIPMPAARWTTLLDVMHVAETRNVLTWKDVQRVTGVEKDSTMVWISRNRKEIAEMVSVEDVEGGIGFDFGALRGKIEL